MRITFVAVAQAAVFLLPIGCSAPPRVAVPARDAEFARLNNSARAAYDRGSLPTACTLYEQAHIHALALDAAAQIGNSAYNLAVCRMALGEDEQARALLIEAEAELTRAKESLTDVLLVQAKLARRQGRFEDARRFAARVLSDPASAATGDHRVDVALIEGQLACEDRDTARAKASLDEAMRQATPSTNAQLRARSEKLAGRIHLLEENPAEAARCFDREIAFCQQARQVREVASALMRSGEAWRDAGQPAVSAERFFRAARSRFAQSDNEVAMKCVELSLTFAAEAHDESLRQRALQLKTAIQISVSTL